MKGKLMQVGMEKLNNGGLDRRGGTAGEPGLQEGGLIRLIPDCSLKGVNPGFAAGGETADAGRCGDARL